MLVLTRKEEQSIVIPGEAIAAFRHWEKAGIEIVLVRIDGDKVRIGIDCPDQVDIYRRVFWRQIKKRELEEVISLGTEDHKG